MASPQVSNITGLGLFLLHPELRNTIYEYVLASIEDNMVIHLEGGANEKHRVKAKKHKIDGVSSPLSLLLTCKEINNEATGVAYSRLSLSLDTVTRGYDGHTKDRFAEAEVRMTAVFDTFSKGIRATAFSHVTRMYFREHWTIMSLLNFDFIGDTFAIDPYAASDGCTDKCQKLASRKGSLHMTLHNIRSITIDFNPDAVFATDRYRRAKDRTSWLSLLMHPYWLGHLLEVFSNLEEIIPRHESGEQQKSYVRNGGVFAGGSGIRIGGYNDPRELR